MMNALYNRRIFLLIVITLLAFALRFYRLDAAGLAEDEANKMEAVQAYLQGEFTINAEHPMLMKSMATASVTIADRLDLPISPEAALRLPNVIFGSLTCLVLYLFFTDMFGFRIGLMSALLWAINLNAILINRVAKEDTLLVFFLWLAYYFCRRAKYTAESEVGLKKRLWGLSGIHFGLMLASKYFPNFLGLNFLYYHLVGPTKWNTKIKGQYIIIFFVALGITFLVFNPSVLMPGIFKYLSSYSREQHQTHHGVWMMGQLYHNEASNPGDSTPIYFYLLALVVKTPIPLLIAFCVGLVEVFRRRDDDHFFLRFMILLWIIPYSVFGAKWLRYMLAFIPLFSVTAAIGLSVGYNYCRSLWQRLTVFNSVSRVVLVSVGAGIFIVVPMLTTIKSAPFYSLYVSPLAGGSARAGYYFPHDEFYDLGLREAVEFIANDADPQALIANETPGVIEYYCHKFGRRDLRWAAMTDRKFQFPEHVPTYVIVQDGRRYFENEKALEYVENNYIPIKEVKVRGAVAAKIYRIFGREDGVQARHNAMASPHPALILQ